MGFPTDANCEIMLGNIALLQLSAVMLKHVVLFVTVAVTMFVQRQPQSYEMNFLRVKTVFDFPWSNSSDGF